ncbi:hypothetical protein HUK80_15765 [Flavobacterium sp. MAH-1]|uniref:Lipocalin-like domain-containing protein n=1 Tax=Flavobacterium agri TaxID=2743471 RepID=A0A7Y8Y4I6_9FLAO|nr:lipocalin family protein [Flavobacterium agri]NUY82362.1 hypothetical protein [Flavobacterium agri]NYA72386.1 hypothetical protein [Flavobacterium agri]
MKTRILIVLFVIISSCKKENADPLLGSWKLKDVANFTGQNTSDKMTFYENGTSLIEIFSNGKRVTKITSKYTFDKHNNMLTITTGKKLSVTYKVVKLNDEELDLEDPKTHTVIRNIRY